MTASRQGAAEAGCSATARASPAVSTARGDVGQLGGGLLGGQPVAEVAAGEGEDGPAVGQPERGDPLRRRVRGAPCPAARPTAGRRGRRRRRPASAARSSAADGRSAPRRDPVAVGVEHGPVGGVGGEVVGQAGAGARGPRPAGCAAGRSRAGGPAGRRRRRRWCRRRPAPRPAGAATGARGRGRRPARGRPRPGRPRGRRARCARGPTGPGPGRTAGGRRVRRPRSRTGPAAPPPGAGSPPRRSSCRSGGLPGAGPDEVGEPARERRPRPPRCRGCAASESRQMVSRSCGLAATPTTSRSAHSWTISGVVSMWNCSP